MFIIRFKNRNLTNRTILKDKSMIFWFLKTYANSDLFFTCRMAPLQLFQEPFSCSHLIKPGQSGYRHELRHRSHHQIEMQIPSHPTTKSFIVINSQNSSKTSAIRSFRGFFVIQEPLTQFSLFIVCMAVYWPALHNQFVFDDLPAIVHNRQVTSGYSRWAQLFATDYWGNPIHQVKSSFLLIIKPKKCFDHQISFLLKNFFIILLIWCLKVLGMNANT